MFIVTSQLLSGVTVRTVAPPIAHNAASFAV